ncbi:myeloid-derived growth factor-like isoform X3 [Branchiostoma floridae]|uniref:Myeloid-derived growth factor-like isoform X3 n=2 Tax=Branchiostoma floridae TaxID=7739 RepID=A0A9J7MCY5_BRAFL|nr:myeloid-derived growth factor-like isoform X3 [Branchiostoma floridae]XP_035698535.1 myeloid-derived growth factor-like isoform X3 [Branchiostoma floridae]XP_035698545.1 myeloid-derived growth factor-like isoform X3 [Branchiostoma floridae]
MASVGKSLLLFLCLVSSIVFVTPDDIPDDWPPKDEKFKYEAEGLYAEDFDLEIGKGLKTFERNLDDVFTCRLSYEIPKGETEEWRVTMSQSPDLTAYSCIIERPGPTNSELNFKQFKMSLIGVNEINYGEAYGEPSVSLPAEEYMVDKRKMEVSAVQGKFKGHISRMLAVGNPHFRHEEL